MNPTRWILAAVAFAIAAATTLILVTPPRRSGAGPGATVGAAPSQVSGGDALPDVPMTDGDVRAQVVLLRAQVAALRTEVDALRGQLPGPARPGDRQAAGEAERTRADPTAREVAAASFHQHMLEVQAAYSAEPTDAGWSASTRGSVQATLAADEGIRPLVREVDCRSRTCRVELSDDGTGTLAKSLPLVLQQLGQTLPRAQAEQTLGASGQPSMVLYFSRAEADGR